MDKLIKIGEIQAENAEERKLLRETLENAGFVIAEYPKDCYEDYLIVLALRPMKV